MNQDNTIIVRTKHSPTHRKKELNRQVANSILHQVVIGCFICLVDEFSQAF